MTTTATTVTTPTGKEERNEREPPVRERTAATEVPAEELKAVEAETTEEVSHR